MPGVCLTMSVFMLLLDPQRIVVDLSLRHGPNFINQQQLHTVGYKFVQTLEVRFMVILLPLWLLPVLLFV